MTTKKGILTSIHTLPQLTITEDNGKLRTFQLEAVSISPIEGFTSDLSAYYILKKYLDRTVDIQISHKTSQRGKVTDINGRNIVEELLKRGTVKLDDVSGTQTGLYSEVQLKNLKKIVAQSPPQIINCVLYPKQLTQISTRLSNGLFDLENLKRSIVISQGPIFISVKLINIDTNFDVAGEQQLAEFIRSYRKIHVKLSKVFRDATSDSNILEAIFPIQLQEEILIRGWGSISLQAEIDLSEEQYDRFQKSQNAAKNHYKGIWSNPIDILELAYVKDSFLCLVVQIIQGNIFVVKKLIDGEYLTVQVEGLECPANQQLGAFQVRQFSRKQALGRQFNASLKGQVGLKSQVALVRLSDNQRYDLLLVGAGWAKIKQDFLAKYTLQSQAQSGLFQLQARSMQQKHGIFSNKLGKIRFEDLSNSNSNSNKQQAHLLFRRIKNLQAVEKKQLIKGVILSSKTNDLYAVRLDQFKIIINVKLQQVESLKCKINITQYNEFKQKSFNYLRQHILLRDVILKIVDFDFNKCYFIAYMFIGDHDVAELLLSQGFVHTEGWQWHTRQYIIIQQKAKQQQKGIWTPVLSKIKKYKQIALSDQPFKAVVSEILNGNIIYYQTTKSLNKLKTIIQPTLKNIIPCPLKKEDFKIGILCVAPFEGQRYRARIISRKKKSNNLCTVLYIDYGNTAQITFEQLIQLPQQLMKIEDLAAKSRLFMIRQFNNRTEMESLCLQQITNLLLTKQFLMVPTFEDSLLLFKDQSRQNILQSCNSQIISLGLCRSLEHDLNELDQQIYHTIISWQSIAKKDPSLKVSIWLDEQCQVEIKKQLGDL